MKYPDPCQPIGCDNGYHLPGCVFATIDDADLNRHDDDPVEVIPGQLDLFEGDEHAGS